MEESADHARDATGPLPDADRRVAVVLDEVAVRESVGKDAVVVAREQQDHGVELVEPPEERREVRGEGGVTGERHGPVLADGVGPALDERLGQLLDVVERAVAVVDDGRVPEVGCPG